MSQDSAKRLEEMIEGALGRWPAERAADVLASLSQEFAQFKQSAGRDAWDAEMTEAERAAAIQAEIEKTERERGTASLPHSWTDPRTANLLGNYATR